MKKLALLGGLGPEATVMYYQGIIEAFTPTYAERGYPEMIIESADLKTYLQLAEAGQWDEVAHRAAGRFESMRVAGAEVGAMTANTPHAVFDEVQAQTELPLISIVTAARDAAAALGLKRPGLLGTGFTMASDFYPKTFAQAGMAVVIPPEDQRIWIHDKIFSEIELGVIKPETCAQFVSIVKDLARDQVIDGVILGCTELPLVLKPGDVDLPLLDTTAIHVAALVKAIQ